MKKHYRIRRPMGPSGTEVARYRDFGRLLHNYQQMTRPLHHRPLYRDPKTFLVILIIVLMAILVSEAVDHERGKRTAPPAPEVAP